MEQTQSEHIGELAKAMVKVQLGLPGAKASAENSFYNNKYANLADCMEAGREILSKNGLAVVQTLGGTAESPSVITTLMHTSGQWIKGEGSMTPDKKGPQAIGSCITYGRRYGYSAIIGLHQEDDDGEGATKRGAKKKAEAPKDKSVAGIDDIPLGEPRDYESPNKDLTDEERKAKGLISSKQRGRLQKIATDQGWPVTAVKSHLADNGYQSSHDIKWQDYKKIVERIESLDMSQQ